MIFDFFIKNLLDVPFRKSDIFKFTTENVKTCIFHSVKKNNPKTQKKHCFGETFGFSKN